MYLDDAGAHVYLITTDLALEWGLIGWGEYATRLLCLRDILEPSADVHGLVCERLDFLDHDIAHGWPDGGELGSPAVGAALEQVNDAGEPQPALAPRRNPSLVHFITTRAGVLGDKWLFHQSDDDFFPSVPHGHLKTKPQVKLDAYRGYTYDTGKGNQALARERRDFIVGLWRDAKFRVFALRALDYFIERHPSFNWWGCRGILHPRRLPD